MCAKKVKLTASFQKQFQSKAQERTPKNVVCRVLIVCEGKKTEPLYFKSFDNKCRGTQVYDLSIEGDGANTTHVVNTAIRLRDEAIKNGKPYDCVWAVFDRDSFKPKQFNQAIIKAEQEGIGCAWSNEAFELWYINHFDYRDTAMSRKEYQEAISKAINKASNYPKNKKFVYKKNDATMFSTLAQYGGSLERAINNSEKQTQAFSDQCYADHNPCTMVYKLVKLLIGQDDKFNEEIKNKMGESTTE